LPDDNKLQPVGQVCPHANDPIVMRQVIRIKSFFILPSPLYMFLKKRLQGQTYIGGRIPPSGGCEKENNGS
jgi:hypothetical protein